jgi:hypothetical protein
MSQIPAPVDAAPYVESWKEARKAREQHRRDPNGYLSYAGFHKLDTGSPVSRWHGQPGRYLVLADPTLAGAHTGQGNRLDDVDVFAVPDGPVKHVETDDSRRQMTCAESANSNTFAPTR